MRLIPLLISSLLITGCTMMDTQPSTEFKLVTSSTWQLESINSRSSLEPARSRLVFDPGTGRLSGRSCNSFFGSYNRGEAGQLSIKLGGATKMSCEEPLMKEEQRLFKQIDKTQRFEIRGDKLYLFGNDGDTIIYHRKK